MKYESAAAMVWLRCRRSGRFGLRTRRPLEVDIMSPGPWEQKRSLERIYVSVSRIQALLCSAVRLTWPAVAWQRHADEREAPEIELF